MLVLVAHGSRDPAWRASVESIVEALEEELGPQRVALAYMDCSPPTLMDVVSAGAEAGIKEFHVLPLFLAPQGHVDKDVAPMTREVQDAYPELHVKMLPPLGQQVEYREALGRIALRTEGTPKT